MLRNFLLIFRKNLIWVHMSFNHRYVNSMVRCNHELNTVMSAVLTTTWTRHRKNKKGKHAHIIVLWDLIARINNKLGLRQLFYKTLLKNWVNRVHVAYQPNELGHGRNHGIVCLSEPISCTCVHIVMANNFQRKYLFYFYKKSLLIFWVPYISDFLKHLPYNWLII